MPDSQNELAQVREFKQTFKDEFMSFESNIRAVAHGRGSFVNTTRDWFNIGFISASTIVANAGLGFLASYALLAGSVATVIGIAVSIIGVATGIFYNRYRSKQDREACQRAIDMMDGDDVKDEIDLITTNLLKQHVEKVSAMTPAQAIQFAKERNKALAHELLEGKMLNKAAVLQWSNDNDYATRVVPVESRSTTSMLFKHIQTPASASHAPTPERKPALTALESVNAFFRDMFSVFGVRKTTGYAPIAVEEKPSLSVKRAM